MTTPTASYFKHLNTTAAIETEAERLLRILMYVQCEPGRKWTLEKCLEIAPLTLAINQLKREKDAIILAHSYTYPEIVYGVADFKSDSYALSLAARNSKAKMIVFAGVVFMAETAKILCPDALVVVPDRKSGCSLADSLSGEDYLKLKAQYPDAATVCYINSSAEVKSLSDVCVTSSNVYAIIGKLPQKQILFVPDRLMAMNIALDLKERGIEKEIVSSNGTCIVHDQFDARLIQQEREKYPNLKVVSHPECTTEVTQQSDFVGSTGKMMDYVKQNPDNYIMMLTECGLVSRLEAENPTAKFIPSCKLCPYMKLNRLENVYQALADPQPDQIIEVDPFIREGALRSIDTMFKLSQ